MIVAAGASSRMGGADKLAGDARSLGRPMLRWSVEAMAAADSVARIIVVARRTASTALARRSRG